MIVRKGAIVLVPIRDSYRSAEATKHSTKATECMLMLWVFIHVYQNHHMAVVTVKGV